MSVSAELVSQHLPLAVGEIGGVNPAYFLAAGALATASYQAKKIIPSWHHTINAGEVGVPLRGGKPIVRENVTAEQIANGESRYVILPPRWYFVPPFRTIQTVYTTDQPNHIEFPLDSEEGKLPSIKLLVSANIVWNVSPDGDNPVKSITEVMHLKKDKKEAVESATDDENRQVLKTRVAALARVALGQTLTGMTYKQLKTANEHLIDEITQETIERSQASLYRYGVLLTAVELDPIARVDAQVTADAFVLGSRITARAIKKAVKMAPPEFLPAIAAIATQQPGEALAIDENVVKLHQNGNNSASIS
jgi:hypothetical protein